MIAAEGVARRRVVVLACIVSCTLACALFTSVAFVVARPADAGASTSPRASVTASPKVSVHARSNSSSAPKTTFSQDTKFLTDVTEADPALVTYELVGEGMMQWAPDHKHVVGYWDDTVEND